METHSYWRRQEPNTPLFPDIEWNKPVSSLTAGKLGLIGGNKLGFAGVAEAYKTAGETGVGQVRACLPDALKRTFPAASDVIFAPSNPSGSLSREAISDLWAIGAWADGVLLIGDAGRNSETAILYEEFIMGYHGPLTLTRDAADLVKHSISHIVERPDTLLVVSFAQLQKIFQNTYYPKILTFSMPLLSLVEAVHKFTTTYPVSLMVLHKDQLIVASNGEVITAAWDSPMAIWRGHTATRAACYWLWNPSSPLQAATASLVSEPAN